LESLVLEFAMRYRDSRLPFLEEALGVDPSYLPVEPGGDLDHRRYDAYTDSYTEAGGKILGRFISDHAMRYNIFWSWSNNCEPRTGLYAHPTSNCP
jgi:hypothetical protein